MRERTQSVCTRISLRSIRATARTLLIAVRLSSSDHKRRDAGDGLCRLLRSVPQVIGLLHGKPQVGAVAAELAEPQRHLRGDASLLRDDAVKLLARHSDMPGDVLYAHVQCRQHDLLQEFARVAWRTFRPSCAVILGHRFSARMTGEVRRVG